jgi:hypothetical protein
MSDPRPLRVEPAADRDDGFTVLDGVALVVAAAVASVHMKTPVDVARGAGWGLVWLAFAGVGLSAAGPILYVARRYGRRPDGYPRMGDRLWAILGSPWIVAAPFRSSRVAGGGRALGIYDMTLTLSVGAASLLVLAILWKVWVMVPPRSRPVQETRSSWTARLGMALSVAWPLQCGFLLVVLDSETLTPVP